MTTPDYRFMADRLVQAGMAVCRGCDKSATALQTRQTMPCDKGDESDICPVKEIFHKADLIKAAPLARP